MNGALVNLNRPGRQGFEREFAGYLETHQGTRATIAPVQYRVPFRPLLAFIRPRGFMILSSGGEVVRTGS